MPSPIVLTGYSAAETVETMVAELAQATGEHRVVGGVLHAAVDVDVEGVLAGLRRQLGDVPVIGCTSCLGPAMQRQFVARQPAATVLWLAGGGFRLGTAQCTGPTPPDEAQSVGERLARRALQAAELSAEQVRFAVFHATPGDEESLLAGALRVLPKHVVLIGGSAADNDLSGRWRTWTEGGVTGRGAALAVCDWPWKLGAAFRSGYLPSSKTALVTRAQGRALFELDGRPAADVYNEWMGGALDQERREGGQILGKSTLAPLGVPRSQVVGTPSFLLAHPERVSAADGSLTLFASVVEGERVTLMHCTERGLVRRSGQVAREALTEAGLTPPEVLGALMIFCGGCVLPIEGQVTSMLGELEGVLGETPVVSAFTFGEQGAVTPRQVEHGNLMASVLLLSNVDMAA
ncbi:MAG: hypothetical protein B7733_26105 [Myxococcales bacterium FL481]|nr:MAG: hypothetical protein B7733_26105 [Myxococcales bacterium FL481]